MSLPVRSSPHRSVTSHYFRNRAGAGDGSRHVADVGSRGGESKALPARLAEQESRALHEARLPVNCVEGWSVGADWRGRSLLEVVLQAGGTSDSRIQLISVEQDWGFNHSFNGGYAVVGGPSLRRISTDSGWILITVIPCG